MKKITSYLLSVILLITMLSGLTMDSYANTSGDYQYELYRDGIQITKYLGTEDIVVVPSKLDGYNVINVSGSIFSDREDIKEVTISEGIEEIGYIVFKDMQSLEKVILSKTVKSIGYNTFINAGSNLEITFLNPECSIYQNAIDSSATIIADEISKAHDYAIKNGNEFIAIDSHYYQTEKLVTPATTDNDGELAYICDNCKEVISTVSIPKIKDVYFTVSSYTYDGNSHTPSVKVKDAKGKTVPEKNYTVKFDSGRKNAGTYNAKVTFKNYYKGTVTRSFTIKKKALTKSDVKIKSVAYTGKATYPNITYKGTKLKKDTDFTVSKISKNKAFGTASFKIKLKGNFSGTISGSYKILPAKVSGISLKSRDTSSITVKWNKSKGASGYKIYRRKKTDDKYALYKTTTATSLKINRFDKYSNDVEIYIVAYKKSGKTTYTSEKAYYSNCVKPKKLKYTVKCNGTEKIKINYTNLDIFECPNVNIQICTNKSFDSKKYDVYSLYASVDSWENDKSTYIYDVPGKQDYYVRCRAVNNGPDDKPVYGSWGEIKKVYVK